MICQLAACVIGAHIEQLDYDSEPQAISPSDVIDTFEVHKRSVRRLLVEKGFEKTHTGKIVNEFAPREIIETLTNYDRWKDMSGITPIETVALTTTRGSLSIAEMLGVNQEITQASTRETQDEQEWPHPDRSP